MIVDYEELHYLREKYRNKRIVLGSGVFDLFHYNHLEYLRNLKRYGDIVVVVVGSDAWVRENKSTSRPIIPEKDRVNIVNGIKGVDYVFISPKVSDTAYTIDPIF